MAKMLLTIQHNGNVFSPPVKDGVKIEWERTGVAGKLTFTTLKMTNASMSFQEGDPVCFYYDDKPVFMGYVFTKKRDREHHIEVTCYDQIRYLKNKYTYLFENKKASQIISALCSDFNLKTGEIEDTGYVIPRVAEENKAALDIILEVLEDTLLNNKNMFVLYDDFGQLKVKNCANMVSTTLIMENTAENFDYTSSIDSETYNQVMLYYKNDDDKIQQVYSAQSPTTMNQWGVLRYYEEVKIPASGQNKANSLLKLYNRKTRSLTVKGAFGDVTVRGGTLIPVKLNLGDIQTSNYMLVEKVTHNFENDYYTMDLTLSGAWEDQDVDVVSDTVTFESDTSGSNIGTPTEPVTNSKPIHTVNSTHKYYPVNIICNGIDAYAGKIYLVYRDQTGTVTAEATTEGLSVDVMAGVRVQAYIHPHQKYGVLTSNISDGWTSHKQYYASENNATKSHGFICEGIQSPLELVVKWIPNSIGNINLE